MINPEQKWETLRLRATPAGCADAPAIFEGYASDPLVARFTVWTPHRNFDETLEFLRRCESVWADESAFPWCLRIKESGDLAGMLEIRPRGSSVDLGYVLARRWWGQGLMTEAVRAIVCWALAQSEIYRVWAVCDIENSASARLLERVGMEREGVLRRWLVHPGLGKIPRDCLCYSIVKSGYFT